MKMSNYVWSSSLDEMIQKEFTLKGEKYEWNDIDCVYYNNAEEYYMEVPKECRM